MAEPKHTIFACAGIKPELEHLRGDAEGVKINYLPQNLHRAPDTLRQTIREKLDQVGPEDGSIILGYGLCSNAVTGLKAPVQGLYIPRVHDCISLYMGSSESYRERFNKYPGTYYLTRGWIKEEKDPLGLMQNEYTHRVGADMAEEAIRYEIRNYDYISYIHTSGDSEDEDAYLERAKENARYFDKTFVEYETNNDFFNKILFGPYDGTDFIYVEPNKTVSQKEFL